MFPISSPIVRFSWSNMDHKVPPWTNCLIFLPARQYFGDPIDCISRDDIPPNLLGKYTDTLIAQANKLH